jgi:hypothetical protein
VDTIIPAAMSRFKRTLPERLTAWISRETAYRAWLAVAATGILGICLLCFGWRTAAMLCLVTYGALGLAGLAHYSPALRSEHTLDMNLTILFEATSGTVLAGFALWEGFLHRARSMCNAH